MEQEQNIQKMKELLDNCKSHNLTIPEEFSTFDFSLFQKYPHIFKITLPKSFTSLSDISSFNNTSIEEIVVSENVSYISQFFFDKKSLFSLPSLTIDNNNPYYKQIDGAIYSLRAHKLEYIDPMYKGECTLLEDTKYINRSVFADCSLTSIVIPNDIDINEATNNFIWNTPLFADCNNLQKLELHNKKSILELSWFISSNQKNQDYKVLKRVAKYLYPSNFRMDAKHVIIHEIVEEIVNGTTMKADARKAWISFIKKSRKSFYQDIADDRQFLDLCLKEEFLDLSDIQKITALSVDKNSIEINTLLLEYQHTHFTDKEIEDNQEKHLENQLKI